MHSIFIVGCSRSGTTLVQSVLAQTPGYTSFPETNILYHMLGDLDYRRFGRMVGPEKIFYSQIGRLLNLAGFTWTNTKPMFRKFLSRVERKDLFYLIPKNSRYIANVYRSFGLILNAMAGEERWIEKTPQNIFCLPYIEKYFPNSGFVHVIRDGADNVASLVDAGRKYESFKDRFGGPDGIDKAIAYWNSALSVSAKYKGKRNHVFIRYEDIVTDPATAFMEVADKFSINISKSQFSYAVDSLIFSSEVWKKKDTHSIDRSEDKFRGIFSSSEQDWIRERISDVDAAFPVICAAPCGK